MDKWIRRQVSYLTLYGQHCYHLNLFGSQLLLYYSFLALVPPLYLFQEFGWLLYFVLSAVCTDGLKGGGAGDSRATASTLESGNSSTMFSGPIFCSPNPLAICGTVFSCLHLAACSIHV
jgi:hypothetical protein